MPKPAGKAFFSIEVTNIRDIMGRFATMRDKGAVEYSRELVRGVGRVLVKHLAEEAPVGKHYTFQGQEYEPARKRLRDSFFYRTYIRGKTVRLSIYSSAGDILRYVIRGTYPYKRGRRTIRAKRKKALAFWWARKKKSVVVKSVQHPGSLPNLFHERAYKEAKPEIEKLQRRAARLMARALLWEAPPSPLEVV